MLLEVINHLIIRVAILYIKKIFRHRSLKLCVYMHKVVVKIVIFTIGVLVFKSLNIFQTILFKNKMVTYEYVISLINLY